MESALKRGGENWNFPLHHCIEKDRYGFRVQIDSHVLYFLRFAVFMKRIPLKIHGRKNVKYQEIPLLYYLSRSSSEPKHPMDIEHCYWTEVFDSKSNAPFYQIPSALQPVYCFVV